MAASHWRTWCLSLLGAAAACSDGTGVRLPPCTSDSPPLTLGVGEYVAIDPRPDSGCTVFPPSTSAEYLVVPQSAASIPGVLSSFALRGAEIPPEPPVAAQSSALPAGEPSPAERFHGFLRQGEATGWSALGPAPGAGAFEPAAVPTAVPSKRRHQVDDTVRFKVLSCLECFPQRFADVVATARAVGTGTDSHLAIFVDTAAPKPPEGLSDFELEQLRLLFDTLLYAADTSAFGAESDINEDSVVIVLMTPVVNKLVTKKACNETGGFVAGFFFGFDLQPGFEKDQRSNRAEIFYSLVADPRATLSCAHTRAEVTTTIPVTFAHEFQHMISYNQHVLVARGPAEVLWLNEALSHLAEEMAGRAFPLGDGRRNRFMAGNWLNAYNYLDSTSTFGHFLLADEGFSSQAERGAQWLFLRYVVDRFAADASLAASYEVTRALVQTARTGASNVAFVTSTSFTDLVTQWALANWVSDLQVPGFTPPPELQYRTVALRQLYDSLNGAQPFFFPEPFPLVPARSRGDLVNLSGTLRAGTGRYQEALPDAAGLGFTLLFSTRTGLQLPARIVPRLNVIRIR